jgi:hypothetical protein
LWSKDERGLVFLCIDETIKKNKNFKKREIQINLFVYREQSASDYTIEGDEKGSKGGYYVQVI